MTDVARCQEAIATSVLDASEPVSYRTLAAHVGGSNSVRTQALDQFYQQHTTGVGAVRVSIASGPSAQSTDPRARVIRITATASSTSASDGHVYGVFPCASATPDEESVLETMATALWAHERKIRNEVFSKLGRGSPLTREAKAFYESDILCAAATSRTGINDAKGEDAVSMFDTMGAVTAKGTTSKPSFFGNSSKSTTSSSSASASTASSSTKSNGFFKQSSASSAPAKAKPAAVAATTTAPETKRIDAQAMNNVLSVDSDSDNGSDDDAPKFVKTSKAAKPRTKRVMISDDEDDEDAPAPPPTKKKATAPEPPARSTASQRSATESSSPTRKRPIEVVDLDDEEAEPLAEDDAIPTGPIKRRKEVTKTYINELGYMTTEKTFEEVEITPEELARERAEAAKKKQAAAAAAAAQKARAAAAAQAAEKANSKSSKASAAGPAKQKKLDFFFARK